MTPGGVAAAPLGERALLLRFGDRIDAAIHQRVTLAREAIAAARPRGVLELVPAYTTLAVWFDPAERRYGELVDELVGLADHGGTALAAATRAWTLPVRYDGPDLTDVASQTGLTADEVIRRHSGRPYTVYLLGFVPGFGYLGDLDPSLVLARRSSPRQRVPAGSVAIAGAQTAVYPLDTPGGWHLIGRTDVVMFDATRDPPALLAAGDTVRFEPVE